MVSEMVRKMDQYIMWKLMKVMGKTILEYLSMSLARIPMIRSGGALKNYVRKSLQTKVQMYIKKLKF